MQVGNDFTLPFVYNILNIKYTLFKTLTKSKLFSRSMGCDKELK